jgi:ATP-dependent DNA helicase DinG
VKLLRSRLNQLFADALFLGSASDQDYVYQVEKKPSTNIAISAVPIEGGRILGDKLLNSNKPVILTSATLSAGGRFDYLKKRLGLWKGDDKVSTLSIESPYDYKKNSILYVPYPFPGPNESDYQKEIEGEILKILSLTKGRTMVLFTSNRALSNASETLRALRLPFNILVQENGADRAKLLEDFKKDTDSVLLGVKSFWQGVDVPGPSLSAVVIDKLPFLTPGTPLNMAREKKIRERDGNPFAELTIPEMVIDLRQGLGRLLRTSTDKGLLAILDSRLITSKSYGKKTLSMLPPSPMTHDLRDVERFMKSI